MRFPFTLVLIVLAAGPPANPLPNPGFEDGLQHWTIRDAMSRVVPEAAHSGEMGLRVEDGDAAGGSSATSARFAVAPGQELTLTFWARARADFLGVYLWLYGSEGRLVQDPAQRVGGGLPICGVKDTAGEWRRHSLRARVPPGVAAVAVWVHSYSGSTGAADLDDFALGGLPPDAEPLPAPGDVPVELPPRKGSPVIVIKLDDLRQIDGKVHGLWLRVAELVESRRIKASAGVICQTLQEATPQYAQWIKDRRASGRWEFWFHGWDHAVHEADGKSHNEFAGRPYAEQKRRFDDAQALALEKLGFPFRTFGPPGGVPAQGFNADTIRVMADDPHMEVWLYPQPIDAAGKALEAAGKVVILDRVWAVNIEGSVGMPDYARFVRGYAANADRDYFVLQGHPMMWGHPGRFEEFVRIVDFLIAQDAVFVTPTECAAMVRKARADLAEPAPASE